MCLQQVDFLRLHKPYQLQFLLLRVVVLVGREFRVQQKELEEVLEEWL